MGRWQMNAGGRGFRGGDAGETTDSRLDSHEIRGLCFLYALELVARNGAGSRLLSQGEQLLADFHVLFDNYSPEASLLHGDLWSGNYAYTMRGEPAIFDPAVYYGDREADLAMTELFGGFGRDFYSAYDNAWPLDYGYRMRKTLYNLYHILNHFNLFGAGYVGQAQGMIDSLLSEVR